MSTSAQRREYGTGSIYQRADGKWIGSFPAGYTRSGKRRRLTVVAGTEQQARSRMRSKMREVAGGKTPGDPTTVAGWSKTYLAEHALRNRNSTTRNVIWAIGYVVEAIGDVKLAKLRPADFRRVHEFGAKKGLSPSSVLRLHDRLKAMLKAAVLEGLEIPPAALLVQGPPVPTNDRIAIPKDTVSRILEAAKLESHDARAIVLLGFLAGLRRGEMSGLTWDRVDIDRGVLVIDRQLTRFGWSHGCEETCGRTPRSCPKRWVAAPTHLGYEVIPRSSLVLGPVKTARGRREVPIVDELADHLLKMQAADRPSSWDGVPRFVLLTAIGGPMGQHSLDVLWKQVLQRAETKHPSGRSWNTHEMRHTFVTELMRANTHSSIIETMVGHAEERSTRGYIHPSSVDARYAADQVANGFFQR